MNLPTSASIIASINRWQAESIGYSERQQWALAEASEKKLDQLRRDLRMARIEEKLDELLSMARITQK